MGNQPVSYTPADSIRPLVSALPLERDLPAHNATMTDWVNTHYSSQPSMWYGPSGDTTEATGPTPQGHGTTVNGRS